MTKSNQSPSQPDKDAARRLGQLPSAPTTPSSQPEPFDHTTDPDGTVHLTYKSQSENKKDPSSEGSKRLDVIDSIPYEAAVDEIELRKFAMKWATHFARHGTGYFEHFKKDMEFLSELKALLTAARADWAGEVLAEIEAMDAKEDDIDYFIEDKSRGWTKEQHAERKWGWNAALAEVEALLREWR